MLKLSEENEVDMLNGYPLVNHGYRTTRKMMTHFDKPILYDMELLMQDY